MTISTARTLHKLTALALASVALAGCASSGESKIPDRPAQGNILDEADILTDSEEQRLNASIDEHNAQDDAARLVIHTYSEDRGEVKDYSAGVGNAWQIGDNNGLLISVDMENRELYVSVSDESSVTDDQAQEVVDSSLTPDFEDGRYYQGLEKAVDDLYTFASGNIPAAIAEERKTENIVLIVVFSLIGLFVALVLGWAWLERRKWNRIADREIAEAQAADPSLEITDEIRKAYRSYRRHHKKPPAQGEEEFNQKRRKQAAEDGAEYTLYAGNFQTWIPLYFASPTLYSGAGTNPSGGDFGSAGGSSFGGGSTFSGGGAGGSF